MVDLHQTEPGLPEGHRWLALSRWGMAWRAGLAVGAIGTLVFGAMLLIDRFGSEAAAALPGAILGGELSLARSFVAAVGAAILGPWLRRYYPFSQSLLFGAGFVVLSAVAFEVFLNIESYAASREAGEAWIPQFGYGVFGTAIFGIPLLLTGAIGYGLAIWATARFAMMRTTYRKEPA